MGVPYTDKFFLLTSRDDGVRMALCRKRAHLGCLPVNEMRKDLADVFDV
jgi:hypothetical protein